MTIAKMGIGSELAGLESSKQSLDGGNRWRIQSQKKSLNL
jgi:hypothetical protein